MDSGNAGIGGGGIFADEQSRAEVSDQGERAANITEVGAFCDAGHTCLLELNAHVNEKMNDPALGGLSLYEKLATLIAALPSGAERDLAGDIKTDVAALNQAIAVRLNEIMLDAADPFPVDAAWPWY